MRVLRRLLPIVLGLVVVLGALAFFAPDLRQALGTEPGSPRSGAATHVLYSAGPVEVRCGKRLADLPGCFDRAWTRTLSEVGLVYQKPAEVRLIEDRDEAACDMEQHDWIGVYCPDQRAVNVLVRGEAIGDRFTLAHEYAHHVQEISGIADQNGVEIFDEAWSRRLELQADCMAAAMLREVDAEGVGLMVAELKGSGRDEAAEESHGAPANSAVWMGAGLSEGTVRSCNTWAAAEEAVS